MDGDSIYKSTWLKATDVEDETALTIKDIKLEEVGQKQRIVLYFDEIDKALVLNNTNYQKLRSAWGKETNKWIQKRLVLYTALVSFQNKEVGSIRVRPKVSE